jgi:head-tail adaptor
MLTIADLAYFDGLEPITLLAPGTADAIAVGQALRRRPSRRELEASGGKYLADDIRWHLPAAEVAEAPLPGARIVDANHESWTVLAVDRETLGSRWACWSRNLAIAGGLDEVIALQQAAWTKDSHGAPLAVWSTYRTGVRARVQPVEADVRQERDQLLTHRRYRVFVAEPLTLDDNFRLLRDGRLYHIVGYDRPQRIDELLVLHCIDYEPSS